MVERIFEDLNFPRIPIRERIDEFFDFLQTNPVSEFIFGWIRVFLQILLTIIEDFLQGDWILLANTPFFQANDWIIPLFLFSLFVAVAWAAAGWRLALFTIIGLGFIAIIDLWTQGIRTLSIVLASGIICSLIGVPLGILMSRSNPVESGVRPVLDFMQTMPAFVYLIPAVALFGLREVPATVATVIFALPPIVRLTNHGIRTVDAEVVEASDAFGSTPWQTLVKVQLPLARPSIMLGLNQTLMLSLSMAVIAAMIGAAGLGAVVLQSLTRLDTGVGFAGGFGIVIIAVFLDRTTQGLGRMRGPNETGMFAGFGQSMKRTFSYIIGGPWGREQAKKDEDAAARAQKEQHGPTKIRMPLLLRTIFVYHVVILGLMSLVFLSELLKPPLVDLDLLLTAALVALFAFILYGILSRKKIGQFTVLTLHALVLLGGGLYAILHPDALFVLPVSGAINVVIFVFAALTIVAMFLPGTRDWFKVGENQEPTE